MNETPEYVKITITIESSEKVCTINIPKAMDVTFGTNDGVMKYVDEGRIALRPSGESRVTLDLLGLRTDEGYIYKAEQTNVREVYQVNGFRDAPDDYLRDHVHPEWCGSMKDHPGHRHVFETADRKSHDRWCGGYAKPE